MAQLSNNVGKTNLTSDTALQSSARCVCVCVCVCLCMCVCVTAELHFTIKADYVV